jgi:hypothetical protein
LGEGIFLTPSSRQPLLGSPSLSCIHYHQHLLNTFQVATVQFTSAIFSGNETFGSVDIWVELTGVLEDPTAVRYVHYILLLIG